MDSIVCIKRVPDSAAKIKIAADGTSIEPAGVDYVISPYDEIALETAIQLKEAHGGTVTVICLGFTEATKEIRQALAMGADKAVLIKDEGGSRGPLGIAKALAEAIQGRDCDALFFGRQSIDADNSAVGVMVAQLLDLPCVTLVTKLEVADGKATAHRESEAGTEVIEVALPAVFTAQRGLAEPRYPAIKGIMMAKKKPIEELEAPAPSGTLSLDKLTPPAERTGGKIVGEGVDAVPELVKLLRQEAKVL
ncbi:MAG: electron transfer flavoprotein subunit beta/FixA family protein [Planctomycetota bacterium]|jgi:electron transfer flavoprotein beta subunit